MSGNGCYGSEACVCVACGRHCEDGGGQVSVVTCSVVIGVVQVEGQKNYVISGRLMDYRDEY